VLGNQKERVHKFILFCNRIEDAKLLEKKASEFALANDKDWIVGRITSDLPIQKRREGEQLLQQKDDRNVIMLACDSISEGFDASQVAVVFCSSKQSTVRLAQMMGRAMRPDSSSGNSSALLSSTSMSRWKGRVTV
jgi:superfamily II DNA or RNA helicase